VDSDGVPKPRSISEDWGDRITRSLVMRVLCGAWLVPAASLIWIGLAATGLREASESSQALALGRTQATALVLALLTVLIGASVFVRQLGDRPPVRIEPQDDGRSQSMSWIWSHGAAGLVAIVAAAIASAAEREAVILFSVAACCGLWAALVVPRVLLRHVDGWSSPLSALVALAAGISFQLTIGWLHLANPTASLAPGLVAEGLALAWVAASAARIDPFGQMAQAAERSEVVVVVEPVPSERVASAGTSPTEFSPAPARPSIPEAAVGR